jgi:hypothetical protein
VGKTPEATTDEVTETETTDDELGAETFEVPDDVSTIEDDQLKELSNALEARGRELAAKGVENLTDDEMAEAEELASVAAQVETELAARNEQLANKQAGVSAALARFATAPAAEPEVTDEETEVTELAAEDGGDTPGDEPGDPDPSNEAIEEAETVTASAPPVRKTFRGASPAFLRSTSKAKEITAAAPESGPFMLTSSFAHNTRAETPLDSPTAVAKALWDKRVHSASFSNIPAGVTSEPVTIAQATKRFPDGTPVLGMDHAANLSAMREVQHALVASGECCTPQNQLYDFFRLAVPIKDVEDAITTVQAPRGGIRYIRANCTVAGSDAIGFYDCDDAAETDPLVEKPCARVSCPEIDEVLVEAISQCVIFDNLQYRTFPELFEDFMQDVAVQFTLRKQRYFLDAIDAASTHVNGIGSYGAARSLLYDLTVAAVGYRRRHHMPRGARLEVFMPDWSVDLVKSDLFNDGDSGLDYMNVPDSAVIEALRARNLDPTFYYDDPTSTTALNTLSGAQAAGDLNDFPLEVTSFLFAPGTFVKLDGGTLDLGLVRDHTLNKTNDFAMFMEEWLGFAMLGCESVRIDSVVCPSGSRAPYASGLRECGAS